MLYINNAIIEQVNPLEWRLTKHILGIFYRHSLCTYVPHNLFLN